MAGIAGARTLICLAISAPPERMFFNDLPIVLVKAPGMVKDSPVDLNLPDIMQVGAVLQIFLCLQGHPNKRSDNTGVNEHPFRMPICIMILGIDNRQECTELVEGLLFGFFEM